MERMISLKRTKVNYLLIIFFFSFFSFWLNAGHASSQPLRIGVIGDQTGVSNIEEAYSALEEGLNILSKQNVQLVLHIGDMVESRSEDEEYKKNFAKAAAMLDKLKIPWYITPGDHDVNPREFQAGSNNRCKEALFVSLYAKNVPQVKEHLYYSFDFGGYHFISLYSHENLHVDPRWGNIFMAQISDNQLRWLEDELKEHKNSKGIIVFTHQPLWYNWTGWMRVHHLLKQYPVITVIAGHFHYNQDEGLLDGIRYAIVGATGGIGKQASREAGKVPHVTVLTVGDRKVDFQLFALDDLSPLPLMPRVDMDRIQAIDMVMNSFSFAPQNLYLKDDQLIENCDTNDPAIFKIFSIGNPIDLPLKIDIHSESKNIALSAPQFIKDFCQPGDKESQCFIPPGKLITLSNLSSAAFNDWVKDPIWTANPVIIGTGPQPGDKVDLKVRLSFQGKSRELFVERRVSAEIKTCNK
jgi:predicted phosphodiesterase